MLDIPLEDILPLSSVYANLLSEALVAIVCRSGKAAREKLGGGAEVKQCLTASDVQRAIRQEVTRFAEVDAVAEELGGDRLRPFLASAEVKDLACQIFASRLPGRPSDLESKLRRRFLATFSWYVSLPEEALRSHSERLVDGLLAGAKTALRAIRATGNSEAAKLLAESLVERSSASLDRALAVLAGGPPDFEATFVFETRYRRAASVRHRRIDPPNYDGAKTLTVEDLYVEPSFRFVERTRTYELAADDVIAAPELVARLDRTIVLGDPGAGKSTFASTLVYQLAEGSREWTDGGSGAVPFLVVLRDFATQKRLRDRSILQFIEGLCNSSYQVEPPPGAIEYLLSSGRAIVVLDGLDELLETRDRRAIRSDVETFAERYPATPVLVTSRVVGYLEAPLDHKRFATSYIREFSDADVRTFVRRWFALDERFSQQERSSRAESFLTESAAVPDLRSNALLLSLMCAIYRRQNYIPRNRANVYEECASMLFERWDRGRQIIERRPLEAHLRPALQHIAYWVFTDRALLSGVTHDALVAHTTEYILNEVIDSAPEARRVAEEFVTFCHGRAWVLIESGTRDDGASLYSFAHRTFLEFFRLSRHGCGQGHGE